MNLNYFEQMLKDIAAMSLEDKVTALNKIKLMINEISPFKNEPVDCVIWVKNDKVVKNDYNPNAVAPPEMKLLETSIAEDGYTQPIVSWSRDEVFEVVDGFHRHRVGKESEVIKERIHGYLPLVVINQGKTELGNRMASTIRHNRARGTHNVDAMSEIVLELKARNWKTDRICRELGMEEDEVLRLCQISGLSALFSDVEFTQAWESDSCSNDDELDFTADFSQITQNTSDKGRIFHTYDKWEATAAGFFKPGIPGRKKADCEREYAEFLSNMTEFEEGLRRVLNEWKFSCEHNLTNTSMNRIAWLGQAAACIARGLPSVYRGGFMSLSEEDQTRANELALKYLNIWLNDRGLPEVDMAAACSHRESDLF